MNTVHHPIAIGRVGLGGPVPRPCGTPRRGRRRRARVPGVTHLGGAAHLMPPPGDGANPAMVDGAEPGKAIAAYPGDFEAAPTACEQALFARTAADQAG